MKDILKITKKQITIQEAEVNLDILEDGYYQLINDDAYCMPRSNLQLDFVKVRKKYYIFFSVYTICDQFITQGELEKCIRDTVRKNESNCLFSLEKK